MELEQEVPGGIAHFPDHRELVVTRVERKQGRQRGRYLIHFGEYSLSVLEDVMIKYRMTSGTVFTKEELAEIVVADERQQAYVHSLYILGRKQRSRTELARRLTDKEIQPAIVEETLDRLEREKLIDDTVFARQWAQQRISSQRKGKLWVRQELRQKGISKDNIAEALGEVSDEEEWDSALQCGRKKWRQVRGEMLDQKRKTMAYLMRRGFTGELSRRVIQRLAAESQEAEMDEDDTEWPDMD
ncbi:RecX family transcriptional regulator [Paenibacillus sp. JX-17]|uniref:Regulatory protein RecX n=1 Tax=Paenibacillus lacisoli TaxID=3064525 RepID=A0ABT9CDT0_9BACL|nr:RecX family transcriptional regulator [Paenibacillus sp. JX-17]MDO7905758.1 RecX family transcriptional regulator [Paenibacillus sp. JX-17]